MIDIVQFLREFLNKNNIDYMLINSTDDFLTEYNVLEKNSRYKATGFSGSAGDALITKDKLFLFVDGRYHIQADLEVNHDVVTVVKLKTGQNFSDEIIAKIERNSVFAIVTKKNSQKRIEYFENKLKPKNVRILLLNDDPIKDDKNDYICNVSDIDVKYTGMSVYEKIQKTSENLKSNEAILVTNQEEVSYLYNKRDFSKPYRSSIRAKAIIYKGNAKLYFGNQDYEHCLKTFNGTIYVDKSATNGYDYSLIKNKAAELTNNPLQLMKSVKTDAEINHLKDAFSKTDKTLSSIREYIYTSEKLSEYDISRKLEELYKAFGAKNLSFKPIVAKDKNSALAHYSNSSKEEIVSDGSLVLIDSGAFYEGGLATDITRVFVKGNPTELHKKVYTTVLKMFLHSYNAYFTSGKGLTGYDTDDIARKIYSQNEIDGFVFNHGLGHGIGVSVHEYPPNLSKNELAKVKIRENMCFTIEPGLYNEKHFGVRLENSCYMQNGKIHSFVNMNFEKKLIEYRQLSKQEKKWLDEFEVI